MRYMFIDRNLSTRCLVYLFKWKEDDFHSKQQKRSKKGWKWSNTSVIVYHHNLYNTLNWRRFLNSSPEYDFSKFLSNSSFSLICLNFTKNRLWNEIREFNIIHQYKDSAKRFRFFCIISLVLNKSHFRQSPPPSPSWKNTMDVQ